MHISILEESKSLLPGFDEKLAHYAATSLQSRGVEIIHQAKLKECQDNKIIYETEGKNHKICTHTFIWTGGVQANLHLKKPDWL